MDPWPAKLAAPATEEQVAAVKAAVEVIAAGGQKPTAALVAVVASRLLRQSHQPQQHTPVAAEHHLTQDDGWSAVAEVKMAADLPCFGQLDLGELDSSTWQTDANVGSMASSAARNRTRLFKATTGRHSLDMQASRVPVAASGSSSGKTKGRVTCQVAGCLQDLTAGRESYTGELCSSLSVSNDIHMLSTAATSGAAALACQQIIQDFLQTICAKIHM
jgi:hypothetical protein